jgi:hypothetical protein
MHIIKEYIVRNFSQGILANNLGDSFQGLVESFNKFLWRIVMK